MAEFNSRMQQYHDGSALGLRLYMSRYWMAYQNRRFWESYWPAFRRCKEKKGAFQIIDELTWLMFTWKCLPYHYFRYGLYDTRFGRHEIINYLPETVFFYQILPKINKQMFLLDDKNIFKEVIKGHGIECPKTVLSTTKRTIFDADSRAISDEEELKQTLARTRSDVLFCKPAACASGGKGIFTLKRHQGAFVDEDANSFNFAYLAKMAHGDWLVQEAVENCQFLRDIYEHSVNSFRVLTYFRTGVGARALYCILKFGNNNAYTDNAHTGGIYVRVDMDTGELDETAYDEDLYSHRVHPLTQVPFRGKRVSNISEVIALAEKLGNICPSLTFIGWDIALTPSGAVVLEGNSSPGLTIIQRTHRGMKEFINLVRGENVIR